MLNKYHMGLEARSSVNSFCLSKLKSFCFKGRNLFQRNSEQGLVFFSIAEKWKYMPERAYTYKYINTPYIGTCRCILSAVCTHIGWVGEYI